MAAGTVGTPGAAAGDGAPVYDHTSILATVRKCFELSSPPLSAREAAAHDLGAFLTLSGGDLNQGPASVSVGISREDLEIQGAIETLSGLAQLFWESVHKIPSDAAHLEGARAALEHGTFDRTPPPRPLHDADLRRDLENQIERLFGRRPVGLLRYE